MNKNLFLLSVTILLVLSISAFSQRSHGGEPFSFKNPSLFTDINHIAITPPDMELIHLEDLERSKNGELHRIGTVIDVDICNNSAGTTIELEDGTKIWTIKISIDGAKALTMVYEEFFIPEGGQLFLYNENRRHVLGAFTHKTNPRYSVGMSTQMVEGDITYLEYIQPPHVIEEPIFKINQIVYNYRNVEQLVGYYRTEKNPNFGSSDPCQVNVNCPEGNNWQDEKRGVALMYIIEGWTAGFCSGSLVNNTSFDGTPYFLSADHCSNNQTGLDNWQFYFHFEAPGCPTPATEPSYETIIGANFISLGPMSGGSDFLLLELHATPQEIADLGLYYNGWDRTSDPSTGGVGIHHPSGDIKKISTYTSTLTTTNFWGAMTNAFWQVIWSSTTTNHGVTEEGSSGSPLFNNNKRIVGTLTGGSSYCTAPNDPDQYGKFSVHWVDNGAQDNRQLRPWLDPQNTGETEIPGYDPNVLGGDPPIANFEANPTTVLVGGTVNFTDLSENNPNSWSWTFQNGDPPTENVQNPTGIQYNQVGTWNVTLTVSNNEGEDTEVKNSYINVVEPAELEANFVANPTSVQEGGTVQFTDQSAGPPTSWSWEFEGGDPATSDQQNPSVAYPDAGIFSVTLTVSDGTDTDEFVRTNYINVTPPGGGDLVASFVASAYNLTAGECINFNDQSQGGPTSWSWSFPGATPLTSTNQNPNNICYQNPGIYDVCLQVTRGSDMDTYCCDGCIVVAPDPTLPIADFTANQTVIPVGGVVQFTNLSENGPFQEWAWTFQGGVPFQFNDSTPPPIAYFQVGEYDVELRCKNTNGIQDVMLKQNYIKVVPQATGLPTANFTANFTTINEGDSINFIDYSTGNPYQWHWQFEGAETTHSTVQHPQNIVYSEAGLFSVTLTASNNFGADSITKQEYIYVMSETDTCVEAPIVQFTANRRLIPAGGTVGFIDQSLNNPTNFTWTFSGGTPFTSDEASPVQRIRYNNPGIYSVTLAASNACGGDMLEKDKYIYVFSGSVSQYCDTLSNIRPDEVVEARTIPQLGWGFLAGHNGDNIREYACRFENHTFSHINGLIVPVSYAIYQSYSAYVTFYVWDGNSEKPDSILGQKKVLIRNLTANQTNYIDFDEPIEINGPFYLGYRINYINVNDPNSNDLFVVGIAPPRGTNPANNTLYVKRGQDWFSAIDRYGFGSSLPIQPITCLVDIDEFLEDFNVSIYPNPSKGDIIINLGDLDNPMVKIDVYDLMGRKVQVGMENINHGEYSINLSNYPDGMYIVRINTGSHIINRKLLLSK